MIPGFFDTVRADYKSLSISQSSNTSSNQGDREKLYKQINFAYIRLAGVALMGVGTVGTFAGLIHGSLVGVAMNIVAVVIGYDIFKVALNYSTHKHSGFFGIRENRTKVIEKVTEGVILKPIVVFALNRYNLV